MGRLAHFLLLSHWSLTNGPVLYMYMLILHVMPLIQFHSTTTSGERPPHVV